MATSDDPLENDDDLDGLLRVPESHCVALDLHRDDGRFAAIYFARNGAAVVINGQYTRLIPASQAAGFRQWLGQQGVWLGEHTTWLVVDSLHRLGFACDAQAAHHQVVRQWGGRTVPMEVFLEEAARRRRMAQEDSEPHEP
jgi:hypothetical protein